MTAEGWKRVLRVYNELLAVPPEQREAALNERCAGNSTVRAEVEALLNSSRDSDAGLPVERPDDGASSAAPTEIGPYEILAPLGEGGMGEVYRARDRRLGRQVALKLLRRRFVDDSARVARFQLEAKAASALDHPNIVAIHDIGKACGTWFIAAELVEGATLRDHIASGKIPVNEAAGIALQCCSALEAAHRAGIVHRDIKPENIIVRPDGAVKILDFGLARIVEPGGSSAAKVTQTGSIMGTPRYMSPEQARGEKVDARSDLFSLGAVLYEMVAGRPAFPGAAPAEVFVALLEREPEPTGTVLDGLLARALAKDRNQRYASISDLAADLRSSLAGDRPRAVANKRVRIASRAGVAAAGLVAVAALPFAWLNRTPSAGRVPAAPVAVAPLTAFAGRKDYATFAPDGETFAFSWNGGREGVMERHIYSKPVGGGNPVQLTFAPEDDTSPAWSPDGRRIAFTRRVGLFDREILIVRSTGGAERSITTGGEGVSWSPDGKWLALADRIPPNGSGSIVLLNLETAERRKLTSPEHAFDEYPAFSPDGKWIAFMRKQSDRDVYVVPASGGFARQLTSDSRAKLGRLTWTADGRGVVYSTMREYGGEGLWRVPVRGGEPGRISSELAFAGTPSISKAGDRLAYTELWIDTNVYLSTGAGFTAAGIPRDFERPEKVIASSREEHSPSFSPDGERIAFVSNRTGHSEIWVSRRDGTETAQLTRFDRFAGTPRWSPDGQRIAFDCILARGDSDVWTVRASGGELRRVTDSPYKDSKPSWSPDGQWIYFQSNRSGADQIWRVRPDGSAASQITREGGSDALPSTDGSALYYTKNAGGAPLWSVPSGGGPETPVAEMEKFDGIRRAWGILKQGIYFASEEQGAQRSRVHFFHFATRRVVPLRLWLDRTSWTVPPIAISPDGKYLLTVRTDQEVNDLMMIQNFR